MRQLTLDEWRALQGSAGGSRPTMHQLKIRRPGEGCARDPRWNQMEVLRSGTHDDSSEQPQATGQFDDAVRSYNIMAREQNSFTLCWVTACPENLDMSGNTTHIGEMSAISVKTRELSEKKSRQGKLSPQEENLPKNCVVKLFSVTHLVLCAGYFMLYIAEGCLVTF